MTKQIVVSILACALAAPVWAQQVSTDKAMTTETMSGKELFHAYCAVCHGEDARGGGPAAVVLKAPPTDLTLLSRRSGGFPLMRVQQTILGDVDIPAHGTREMPIYGELFRDIRHDETFVQLRLSVLVNYIASFQQK